MYYEYPDAPSSDDIFEYETHTQIMELRGEGKINGIKIRAIFDEKIDGNDYFKYVINNKSMNFSDAYDFLLGKSTK